ncbi:SbcC/MukB-like Walker B domain-containing protein [Georgenia sp. SUBG003]|uniref:ATP-binding protein n=1 Tax=Georgenia sp. SUBG003 TaxID=1497974 RepID=UPI0005B7F560
MSAQPIFHLPGATEGTTQWKAETLQVANWGGFHGHREITFSPDSTLISGASGSGKSTLLDAYTALMMPADTPFNGASNDATTGRARGAEQRSLVTYLRGKTDSNAEDGEMRDAVLRGDGEPTWGAVAMTFIDDNGRRLTALRAYFVPAGAQGVKDLTMRMAAREGRLDLRALGPVAADKFETRALRIAFPDLRLFDTYNQFADYLSARLGIGGSDGDGTKALRLLARIQAGHQIKTVDGLYKAMVLETPGTFKAADEAIAHFTNLERAYEAMETEAHKEQVLAHIPDHHRNLVEARNRADRLDTLGVLRPGDTPFRLWRLHTEKGLLDGAADDNRAAYRNQQGVFEDARARERDLADQIGEVQQQRRDNGGDALESLGRQIEKLTEERDTAVANRERFDERTAALDLTVTTAADLAAAQDAARRFLDGQASAEQELENRLEALNKGAWPLEEEHRILREERDFLTDRTGLVPQRLHEARTTLAAAAGLTVEDLPFVAELIDLAPGQEEWRRAAEVTLSSVARVMLVDADRLEAFSRAIDKVPMRTRIRFEGVPLHLPAIPGDPARISGKLVHADSPFTGWVQARLRRDGDDALCVATAADLSGGGLRVTPAGQTRKGRSGAHGWDAGQKPIIGFSNEARLAEIAADLAALNSRLGNLGREATAVRQRLRAVQAAGKAHQFVLDTRWATIDVAGAETALAARQAERDRILADSDVLAALEAQETRLTKALDDAAGERHRAKGVLDALEQAYETLCRRQDTVGDELERFEHARPVLLPAEHAGFLTEQFHTLEGETDVDRFDAAVDRLRKHLRASFDADQTAATRAEAALTDTFRTYLNNWPDPNLGTSLASYPQFLEILTDIVTTGLHHRRQEWKRRLAAWSGEDLVALNGAFETAHAEIDDRLDPINTILRTLSFGPDNDRLQIDSRRLVRDDVVQFRRTLRRLSSGSTVDATDEETETRFRQLRAFMEVLRATPGRPTTQRDALLDVRRHVEITAIRQTQSGVQVATYASLGGKSGGESQELVAFIVGAALQYQLGDETRTRPRFAPVFLDEGFVKSDGQFASRAVSAWKGLGFQLIVGAPEDKVTALEPHMDLLVSVTKNTHTGVSYISPLRTEVPA